MHNAQWCLSLSSAAQSRDLLKCYPHLFYPERTAHQVCNSLSIVGCVCTCYMLWEQCIYRTLTRAFHCSACRYEKQMQIAG